MFDFSILYNIFVLLSRDENDAEVAFGSFLVSLHRLNLYWNDALGIKSQLLTLKFLVCNRVVDAITYKGVQFIYHLLGGEVFVLF